MLEKLFRLDENRTTIRIEIIAGLTTYLTMAYIVFVNPLILSGAGMDRGAVFVATCLASAFATVLMALFANYPLALAPGMGMNAYFAYSVVKGLHYSWQVALGAVFISGVLFLILSLTRIRSWIVDAIPLSQKMAISAGIGLFLGIIALKEAGIIAANPDTLVTLGDLKSPATLLACAGFIVMVALDRLAVPGAIIIAILAAALTGILLGISPFAGSIAAYATAPALLFVACLMTRGLAELDWDDVTEYAPAVVTALAMPLTFSIANGIAFGFIAYAAVKLLSGRFTEVGPSMLALAVLFIVKYAFF